MHSDDKVNHHWLSPKPRRPIHSPVVDISGTSESIMVKTKMPRKLSVENATPNFEKVTKKSLSKKENIKKNTLGNITLSSSNSNFNRNVTKEPLTKKENIKDTPGDILNYFSPSDSDTVSIITEDDDDINEEKHLQSFESSKSKITKSTIITPPKQKLSVNSKTSTYNILIWIFGILGIFATYIFGYCSWNNSSSNIPVKIVRIDISHEINLLPKSFPNQQEDTWKRFSIGIRNIEKYVEPAIFFMVQWNQETQEKVTSNNIAFAIAEAAGTIAAKYLGKINDTASPIVLTEQDMKFTDHGALVSLYKEELEARHVMIIQKIEKVAGRIAQGLRYICDEYNPLVNRSAIFIILNADGCRGLTKNDIFNGSTDSLVAHSERCLTDLWGGENGLEPDILMPLLARIINIVIRIMPENESIPSVDN